MMTTFKSIIPVLPALNMANTLAFYQQHFGFEQIHLEKDYSILGKDDIHLRSMRLD
jgi:uncharacterized glyoxalase superfamily protein PhnB